MKSVHKTHIQSVYAVREYERDTHSVWWRRKVDTKTKCPKLNVLKIRREKKSKGQRKGGKKSCRFSDIFSLFLLSLQFFCLLSYFILFYFIFISSRVLYYFKHLDAYICIVYWERKWTHIHIHIHVMESFTFSLTLSSFFFFSRLLFCKW